MIGILRHQYQCIKVVPYVHSPVLVCVCVYIYIFDTSLTFIASP